MTDQTTMRAFYVQCLLFLFLPLMMMIGPIFIIVPYTWFRHFIQRARGPKPLIVPDARLLTAL